MNDFFSRKEDYDNLRKVLSADSINQSSSAKPSIITSIDDVFSNFKLLVEVHPFYSGSNINVNDYLEKNVKKPLSTALSNNDSRAIKNICFKVGQAFRPSYSARFHVPLASNIYLFFKEKKDEYAFSEGFRQLIEKYKNNKISF